MAGLSWASVASLALLFRFAWSQQLQGTPNYLPYPQLSSSCLNALNTSVACPRALGSLAVNGGMIDSNGTAALCVASCYSSLKSARSTIAGACTGSNDSIVYNGVGYPGMLFNIPVKVHRPTGPRSRLAATFFADNYLFTYNTSCRTDR